MGLSLPKSNLIFLKKCLDKWVHFNGLLTEFDDSLFFSVCDVMTVYSDGKVAVRFRDGAEIETFPDFAKK